MTTFFEGGFVTKVCLRATFFGDVVCSGFRVPGGYQGGLDMFLYLMLARNRMAVRLSRVLLLLYYELETSPSLSCLGAANKYFFIKENSHGAAVSKMATVLILTLVVLLIFAPPPAFK